MKFERRSTVVPQMVCVDGVPCFKSRPYWVMSLSQDGVRYELSRSFNVGSETPPASVEISGVRVREGTQVKVVADVEPVSTEYAIVTEVSEIEVLSGLRSEAALREVFPTRMASGWTCTNKLGSAREYQLSLWYGCDASSTSMPKERFHLVLETRGPGSLRFRKVAQFEDLTQRISRHDVTFDGQSYGTAVKLRINQGDGAIFNIPAQLSLVRFDPTDPARAEQLELELECAQNQ